MPLQNKINALSADGVSSNKPFFSPANNNRATAIIQKQETDLPGNEPEPPRNTFTTPDSIGITNNKDNAITLAVHIDFLPSHTKLHVFIANEPGGSYRQGAPLEVIGDPGKGGDYEVTLSPALSHFYIRFEARSLKTNINVPNITGTCIQSLD